MMMMTIFLFFKLYWSTDNGSHSMKLDIYIYICLQFRQHSLSTIRATEVHLVTYSSTSFNTVFF